MSKVKRLLGLLLTVVLISGCFSVTAYAETPACTENEGCAAGTYNADRPMHKIPVVSAVSRAMSSVYSYGANSGIAQSAPEVTVQPKATVAGDGSQATFSISATGGNLTYQWQYCKPDSNEWTDSRGVDYDKALFTPYVGVYMNGYRYRCKVSNSMGTVYSDAVTLTVTESMPKLTTQPIAATAKDGETVTFSIAASGGNLNCQWEYRTSSNGTWSASKASDSRSEKLSVDVLYEMNGYQFRCKISNSVGTTYSDTVTLTVTQSMPRISKQPDSVTTEDGRSALFSITASGGNLSYQWEHLTSSGGSWEEIDSATGKSLSLDASVSMDNYRYRCKVSNAAGTVYSDSASLTVYTTVPGIIVNPKPATAAPGERAVFSVTATGGNLSYQWQYRKPDSSEWTDSHGIDHDKATFTPDVSSSMDGYVYRCKVSNYLGTVHSEGAVLTIAESVPNVAAQPVAATAVDGETATFSTTATGGNLTYQWEYCTGQDDSWMTSGLAGSQTPTLSPQAASAMNGYKFRCKVSNSKGSVYSEPVTLTVTESSPKVTKHPIAVTMSDGMKATFSVTATGGNLTYQWEHRTSTSGSWVVSDFTGNQTATITPQVTSSMNDYQFRCKISNTKGSVYSYGATLHVPS